MKLRLSKKVQSALENKKPILALESTIITHGLPVPRNLELAKELEQITKEQGVTPATIAIFDGCVKVGLEDQELEHLASLAGKCHKFSSFDLPIACGMKLTGSTTVAGTSQIAYKAGIKVFATGGIGGVHKEESSRMDISHDLKALSENPILVVSSGAKCILDLESTLEQLETLGVPHVGWKTHDFPAFYYNKSGLRLSHKTDSLKDIAEVSKHLKKSALLVANPIPKEFELPKVYIEALIKEAHEQAKKDGVSGKKLTPYLLDFLCRKSEGKTLETNCALIKSNVELGSLLAMQIA